MTRIPPSPNCNPCGLAATLALAALIAGCFSREEVIPTRYFQPEMAQWPAAPRMVQTSQAIH